MFESAWNAQGTLRSYAAALGGDPRKARFTWTKGPRYTQLQRGAPIEQFWTVECDVFRWETPNKTASGIIGVVALCPSCALPMWIPASQYATNVDEDGMLTAKVVLDCPSHWEQTDGHGHKTGQRVKCGWQGIIIDGHAHNRQCPAADLNRFAMSSPTPHDCLCGGLLTPDEARALPSGRVDRS